MISKIFRRSDGFIEKHQRFFVIFYFIVFLLIGLTIYHDFGLSRDEASQRKNGKTAYEHVVLGKPYPKGYYRQYVTKWFNGQLYEMLLYWVEKQVYPNFVQTKYENSKNVYQLRHLLYFLTFYFACMLCSNKNSFGAQLVNSDTITTAPDLFLNSHFMLKHNSFGVQLVNTDTLTTAPGQCFVLCVVGWLGR